VYELLSNIPKGEVTTYGDIAQILKIPNGSRGIARILNKNPTPILIPCHRVVQSNGFLGGYAYGWHIKKELLKMEGIKISQDGFIENFERIRFKF